MATQADGTVYINSSIDTDGFTAGGKEIEAAARRAAKTVKGIGDAARIALERQTAAFVKSNQLYAQQEQKVKNLEKQLEEMANQKVATTAYTSVEKEISKLETALEKAREKKEKFLEGGGDTGSKAFWNINYNIEQIQDKLLDAIEKKKQLEASGDAYQSVDTSAIEQKLVNERQRLLQMNNSLNVSYDALRTKIEQYSGSIQESARYVGLYQSALNALKGAAHAPISALQLLGNAIRQIPHATLNLVSNGLHKIADAAKTAAKRIGSGLVSGLKKAGAAMLSFHKSTQKSNGSLGGGIKTLLKYGLGIRSLYALFNKARSAIKEGFQNLAQYSSETNTHLSALMSSLTQLKNSLAAAFAPILTVIAPILTKFINLLSQAITYVGMFFAALTGKKSFTKAVAVQQNYADSLGDTAKNTKEAAKETNKYLSGLDEIRTYSEDADSALDGSGDGGAGGISPSDMFEEVEIPDWLKDIADWFKQMWEDADFYELGKLLGEKLKEALDNIPWDYIKEIARKIGKSIATFINGFIEVEGLGYSIGRTLIEAINTAFELLNAFVHNLHWDSLGKFIAETLNGIFENIDWPLIYDTFVTGAKGLGDAINSFADNLNWDAISTSVSNFVNTLVDTIYTFITTTDWKSLGTHLGTTISNAWTGINWSNAGKTIGEAFKAFFDFISSAIEAVDWWAVGESVKDFLIGIDWAGVADAFFEAIGAAIGGLAAFLGGLITDAAGSVKEYFEEEIEKVGGDIVLGILLGILEANKNITEWINEHIFRPFIEGFKSAFGIASPSTVMYEMGTYIIQGLLDGINSLVESVTEIWETMKQTAIETWESVKESLSETWENIKEFAIEKWEEIKEEISTKLEDTKEKITSTIDDAKQKWSDGWENMREKVSTILESIKSAIQSAFEWISEKVAAIKEKLSSIGGGISGAVSSFFGGGSTYSISASGIQVPVIPVPQIATSNIPYLATGAVIPANAPFLAMLGDQKNGKNLEMPEKLLREVIQEELGKMQRNGQIVLEVKLDRKVLYREIIEEAKLRQTITGRNGFSLA